MRGRNFHTWSIDRVLADIADARARGARAIFIVDDNITLNVSRFEALCRGIIAAGFQDVDYLVQAMTSSIAARGETLAPLMREAGFRYVFLGIENILDEDLAFLKASAKNAQREAGRISRQCHDEGHRGAAPARDVCGRRAHRRQSRATRASRSRPTSPSPVTTSTGRTSSIPTPYPGTPMTRDFRERDLIVSDDVDEYDGTTAVVRSEHLAANEIEFMRWRAERWMKLRHFWPVMAHSPWFVLRHGHEMLGHTFRGVSWRSLLGLESRARCLREVQGDQEDGEAVPVRA